MISELKKRFGEKCSGINVNGQISQINVPSKQMKFCEAVNYSFKVPLKINKENLGCPGARRSLGFDENSHQLVNSISENTKIPEHFILNAFTKTSVAKVDINQVVLGITESMEQMIRPDLFIVYLHPARVTEIMQIMARREIQPSIPTYSLLSVCGNVFANSYTNNVVSISFGCPESRNNGGVDDSEIIVGVPASMVKYLLN